MCISREIDLETRKIHRPRKLLGTRTTGTDEEILERWGLDQIHRSYFRGPSLLSGTPSAQLPGSNALIMIAIEIQPSTVKLIN
jgi:hypothetical protein